MRTPCDTITFTVSGVVDSGGIKRVDCSAKMEAPAVTPTYTWEITQPVPLATITGSGPVATAVATQPGDYSCTFTASAARECDPPDRTIGPETVTVAMTAVLTRDPSSISATTAWPDMPDFSFSEITVEWAPPECEGTLEVVELGLTDGYQPPSNGTLQRINTTLWRYTAFDEPQNVIHPKTVRVWIGALKGGVELNREQVQVLTVHNWWITPHQHGPDGQFHAPDVADYTNDYDFIRWKYATVLATTGGVFSDVQVSTDFCVTCLGGPCVAACTFCNTARFSATAFDRSENGFASTIGHELVHVTAVCPWLTSECDAYTWELDHQAQTGIDQDFAYLEDIQQRQAEECGP